MNKKIRIYVFMLIILSVFLAYPLLTGCGAGIKPLSSAEPDVDVNSVYNDDKIYTFIWMSDTQYYSESHPDIFTSMTKWITANKTRLNIKYVFHTGDVVDNKSKAKQWKNASASMSILDKNVPYIIAAGNHDVGASNPDYNIFFKNFGYEKFKSFTNIEGLYRDGKGRYDLATFGDTDYIFLAMGWDVDDESVNWINTVLKLYPSRYAVLLFHNYMNTDGSLTSSGETIYNKVVVPNSNVKLLLCGHEHGTNQRINKIDDNNDGTSDRTVYQILTDYQGEKKGGNGFLKILTVDEKSKEILFESYSPYIGSDELYEKDKYPANDSMVMPFEK